MIFRIHSWLIVTTLNKPTSDIISIHQFIRLKSKQERPVSKEKEKERSVSSSECTEFLFSVVHFQRLLFLNKLKGITWRPSGRQLHPGHELQVGNVLLIMPASVLRFQLESKYFPSNSTDSLFGVPKKTVTDSLFPCQ